MGSSAPRPDGWTRVRFGDVVALVRDRVSDITSCGLDKYVRGEDFDPGQPLLSRHSRIGDGMHGPAFHMRFRRGDVLYVSRNPRLRKAVQVDFDGICANTTYICRADGVTLLQDLLVYVMQSEAFTAYAKQHQRGSTNFYVNWSDLEPFEFDLPPLEHQKTIATTLTTILTATEAYSHLARRSSDLRASLLATFARNAPSNIPLQSACKSPITYGIVQAGPHVEGGVPYIRVSDMTRGDLTPDGMLRTTPELAARFERSRVEAGDVVVALRGVAGLPAIVPPNLDGANLTQGTARVSLTGDYDTRYIFWMLQSPPVKQAIAAAAKGSTFKEITLASLRTIEIPVFPLDEQQSIANKIDAVDLALRQATQRAKGGSAIAVHVLGTLAGTD